MIFLFDSKYIFLLIEQKYMLMAIKQAITINQSENFGALSKLKIGSQDYDRSFFRKND